MQNDLDKNNIHSILKNYFEDRFNDLAPSDFEKVIEVLLNEKFDSATVTKKSGDFGADVIAYDGDTKIIVEVKRYKKSNRVSNDKINNLVAAKNYYDANKCIFITTSDFTNAALTIAEKSDIELWNWNRLTKELSETFWNGHSFFDFYSGKDISSIEGDNFSENDEVIITLNRIDYSATDQGLDTNWMYFELENNTDNVIDASLTMPKIITPDKKQFDSDAFQTGYFLNGKIYPGAKVQPSFCVHHHKVGWIKPGTKIYIGVAYSIADQEQKMKQCSVEVTEHDFPINKSDTPNKSIKQKTSYDKQGNEGWGLIIFFFIMLLTVIMIVYAMS